MLPLPEPMRGGIAYNIIANNQATHAGGGIQCVRSPDAVIINNLIVNNVAVTSTGGGVDVYDCRGFGPQIANNTIVGNHSPEREGSGIAIALSDPVIRPRVWRGWWITRGFL